jgi:hypothetical protein
MPPDGYHTITVPEELETRLSDFATQNDLDGYAEAVSYLLDEHEDRENLDDAWE